MPHISTRVAEQHCAVPNRKCKSCSQCAISRCCSLPFRSTIQTVFGHDPIDLQRFSSSRVCTVTGACRGCGRPDPVLERRPRDGRPGGVPRHRGPLPAAFRHRAAGGEPCDCCVAYCLSPLAMSRVTAVPHVASPRSLPHDKPCFKWPSRDSLPYLVCHELVVEGLHVFALWPALTARPFVCLQVTILGRHEADELLLLASDGLWDVLSNQEACRFVRRP